MTVITIFVILPIGNRSNLASGLHMTMCVTDVLWLRQIRNKNELVSNIFRSTYMRSNINVWLYKKGIKVIPPYLGYDYLYI